MFPNHYHTPNSCWEYRFWTWKKSAPNPYSSNFPSIQPNLAVNFLISPTEEKSYKFHNRIFPLKLNWQTKTKNKILHVSYTTVNIRHTPKPVATSSSAHHPPGFVLSLGRSNSPLKGGSEERGTIEDPFNDDDFYFMNIQEKLFICNFFSHPRWGKVLRKVWDTFFPTFFLCAKIALAIFFLFLGTWRKNFQERECKICFRFRDKIL